MALATARVSPEQQMCDFSFLFYLFHSSVKIVCLNKIWAAASFAVAGAGLPLPNNLFVPLNDYEFRLNFSGLPCEMRK